MKTVLIIAHLFHASPRIPGLAKYLPEFGWQPIVLTPPLGQDPSSQFGPPNDFKEKNRVIETLGYSTPYGKKRLASKKYRKIRPVLKFFYRHYQEMVQYPDAEKRWKPFAVKTGNEFLQKEHVDAILSSSSPATAHIIAKELKEKHEIPWIADFRDPWTQSHNYSYSRIRKLFEERLELDTLSSAEALVTTSKYWANNLKILHKKPVHVVTNGFDPELMKKGRINLTKNFTITYTGQIYPRKQDPAKLLSALKTLISGGEIDAKDVEIRFFGPENEPLNRETERLGLSGIVRQYGVISREMSFEKQRESQVLLLLNWDDPQEKGVFTGKIFEYLASKRPILATGGFGGDVVQDLLVETNSGIYCSKVEEIADAVKNLYLEYKSNGNVTYRGIVEKINKYSYREMARNFAKILDGLTERK
ncbi:MAG TPA: glycosyltransferase [Candidatus Bathyarchaeia archaeon]